MCRKNKFELSLVIFGLFSLLIINMHTVIATQPYLPTTIYGKIYNANGEPAVGIVVSVVWIDAEDNQKTSTITTLSAGAYRMAKKNAIVGYYFFNQGFIQAKLNSEIIIIINGFEFEKVSSNPGSTIKVRDAIFSSKSGQTSTLGRSSGTSSSTSSSGSTSDDIGTSTSTSGDETGSTNGLSSSGGDDTESRDSSADSSASSSSSEYVPTPTAGSKTSYSDAKADPTSPTNLFGQIVDENGKPIEGESVTAEWTDEFGLNHTSTTKTLSEKEANALGNKSLEGFYTFNKGDIKAKPNSTISIKTKNSNTTMNVESKPGETTKLEKMQLFGGSSEKKENIRPIINKIINQTGDIFIETISKQRKNLVIFLLPLSLIMLILIFYYIHHKKLKQKKIPEEYQLYKNINWLLNTKIKTIMTKNVITISKDDSLLEALNIIVSQNKNSLIVVSNNKPVGIISESDLVNNAFNQGYTKQVFDKLKVKDIMSYITPASGDIIISECIKLLIKNKIRKLAIVKNGKLIGIVTVTDLLEFFNKFFSKNIIESINVPLVGNAMSNKVAQVKFDAKLLEVCNYLAKEAVDYALVLSNNGGIVTTKDIIDEFYKNLYNLDKLKVDYVVKSPIVFITPGYNIIEANRIMSEKNFRRLPVVLNKKFVGVLSQTELLNSVYSFLCDITKKVARPNKVN